MSAREWRCECRSAADCPDPPPARGECLACGPHGSQSPPRYTGVAGTQGLHYRVSHAVLLLLNAWLLALFTLCLVIAPCQIPRSEAQGHLNVCALRCCKLFAACVLPRHRFVSSQQFLNQVHRCMPVKSCFKSSTAALQVPCSAANRRWATVDRQQRPVYTLLGCSLSTAELCSGWTSSRAIHNCLNFSVSNQQLCPTTCTVQVLPAYSAAGFHCGRDVQANNECSPWAP